MTSSSNKPGGGSEEFPPKYIHETRATFILSSIYGLRLLGLYMVLPVLSLHAASLEGATPMLIGLSLGSYGLTQALLQVPFGIWSDRYGRRRVIAVGLLLFAAGSAVSALATYAWILVIGRILQGAGAIASAVVALLADVSRPQVRTRAMAVLGVCIGLSFAVGLTSGPGLAAIFGVPNLFWLTTILSVGAALVVMFGISRPPRASDHDDVEWHKGQIPFLLRQGAMLRLDVTIFMHHLVATALFVVGPVLMVEHLEQSKHGLVYIYIMPIAVAMMVLSSIYADRRGMLRETILAGTALLMAGVLVLLMDAQALLSIVVSVSLIILGVALAAPAMPAMLTRLSPPHARGTAAGLFHVAQFIGSFLGGVLGGVFLHRPFALSICLLAGMLLAFLAGWGLPRLKSEMVASEPQIASAAIRMDPPINKRQKVASHR